MWIWTFLLFVVALGTAQGTCGGQIRVFHTGYTYTLESPGFPNGYADNLLCTWEIIGPLNNRITLNFTYFDLEENSGCSRDYVYENNIFPGGVFDEECFCGNVTLPFITSKENYLKITFRTDKSVAGKGFRAIAKAVEKNPVSAPEPRDVSKKRNVQWLLNHIKKRKALELPRAALALYLAEPEYFEPGNQTGAELRDRLTISILAHISRNTTIRSQELAVYVQALLVVCEDPRDFYGRDLVSELRARVDLPSTFTNPFEILALCNAGANVTSRDVDRVSAAFDSQNRPLWTDVQATATMALQCLSSRLTVDERDVREMQDELKKRQFNNGTVENIVTTALVVQALTRNGSSVDFFNLTSALEVIQRAQGEDGSWGGSVRNSFYLLPALSGRSFLDIGHAHCPKITESEEESLARLQESGGGRWVVQYSVWLGSDVDLGRTWRLRVPSNKNTSFYDVLEMVSKLDSRHNVTYQVVDGKPYVRSLLGKEDDSVLGLFWFTYVRSTSSKEPPTLLESSPADVLVNPNQELIMWYRPNSWREDRA